MDRLLYSSNFYCLPGRAGGSPLVLVAETVSATIGVALERSRQYLRRKAELDQVHGRYTSLSNREREVMTLVVSGCLNKQVGYRLSISVITVKAHRGRVMRKMAAESLPHLVQMANELDIARVAPRARQRALTDSPASNFAA